MIIATGATAKYLGLPSEQRFRGMGVSACATCDGFFYRKKDVAVVGGGDTACEEAAYLSTLCNRVYLIVRKPYLRASKAMQEKVAARENITLLLGHTPKEILGDDDGVTGITLTKLDGTEVTVDLAGVFIAIGHHPNTEIFAGQIELDENGYIKTQPGRSFTNVEGVFAAGDVQDPIYRQAVTAAASGCPRRNRLREVPGTIILPEQMYDPVRIFNITDEEQFRREALALFAFQAERCEPYRRYLQLLGIDPGQVDSIDRIPYLPIGIFKTHEVYCGDRERNSSSQAVPPAVQLRRATRWPTCRSTNATSAHVSGVSTATPRSGASTGCCPRISNGPVRR